MKLGYPILYNLSALSILEYLGGIETSLSYVPREDHLPILEYLGGIETIIYYLRIQVLNLILEYLGGIETGLRHKQRKKLKPDFRIPRRD